MRRVIETSDGGWWKRGKTPHTFIGQTSVLSTCIATGSCEKFSIPILLSMIVYLILLIIVFYKVSMIVNLTFWGVAKNPSGITFFQ